MINFKLKCIPPKSTAQQQKTAVIKGSVRKYDPTNVKAAKNSLLLMLLEHAPRNPILGPLDVEVDWIYPLRKSETKGRRLEAETYLLPCDTRPDVDNLQKALFDQMTIAGFWLDDCQIVQVRFRKAWGKSPGVRISIRGASLWSDEQSMEPN